MEPNSTDLILSAVLLLTSLSFFASFIGCRFCIDRRALEEKRKNGEAREYFTILPPASVVREDWRFLARFRDRAGYTFAVVVLYFIGRAVWHSIS